MFSSWNEYVEAVNGFVREFEDNGSVAFLQLLAAAETPFEVANATSVAALSIATVMREQANAAVDGVIPLIAPDEGLMSSLRSSAEVTAYRAVVVMSNGDIQQGFAMIHALIPEAATDDDAETLANVMWFLIRLGEAVQSGMMETEVTMLDGIPDDIAPEDFLEA